MAQPHDTSDGATLNKSPSPAPVPSTSPSGKLPAELQSCIICRKKPARLCATCRSCSYCSKKCQKEDWPTHKFLCKAYSNESRPTAQHKRAILFTEENERPSLIWVHCTDYPDEGVETADLSPYMEDLAPSVSVVHFNHRLNQVLEDDIIVYNLDDYLSESKPTRSLYRATAPLGFPAVQWRGPIMVMRKVGRGSDAIYSTDMTLADYRNILDYFVNYGKYNATGIEECGKEPEKTANTMRGVKITCKSEQDLRGKKPFVAVQVSTNHAATLDGEVSPISKLVNMPFRAWKIPQSSEARGHGNSLANQAALFLMIDTNPKRPRWGFAPRHWQHGIGDVLLVREDGEDLTLEQAEVLSRFCQYKLIPMVQQATETEDFVVSYRQPLVGITKQSVVDFITAENVEAFKKEMYEWRDAGKDMGEFFESLDAWSGVIGA
ncbi:hypothetical protein BU16DRAFT_39086 [Lophium mytilinum]|uniref:MYND-type domain-containing protein n=1 Tax=Lophium mytilinum TaxID=390894 RepID=A0A6A6RF76_9PEZI|nr:hypothetical protein BU16DRAFT_39086 [Lophium mytilinum]